MAWKMLFSFFSFHPEKNPLLKMSSKDTVLFNVILNCEVTKSSETKQLHFESPPTTFLEIKKRIEEIFSIPSCIQTLCYQSVILKDSDELQHTHFRSGDTFTVDYQIEGNCKRVETVIKWLREILELFQILKENDSLPDEEKDPSLSSHLCKLEDLILTEEKDRTIGDLILQLFSPWEDERTYVNKLHFHHEGGLDVLMKVYGLLVSKEWGGLGVHSELHLYMECLCSQAVTGYMQTFPLCRQVIKVGGLEICLKTLLRKKVGGNGGSEIQSNSLVKAALKNALHAVCK